MRPSPHHISDLIIGAGPAGLVLADGLGERAEIFEAGQQPYGLSRTHLFHGVPFDLGAHAFWTRSERVRCIIESENQGTLHRQDRRAYVLHDSSLVKFPFQANLFGLPIKTVENCLVGLINRSPSINPSSFDEWLRGEFGDGLYYGFMRPYNTKVWGGDLDRLSPSWAGGRVVQPDMREIVAGALEERSFTDFPNAQISYPTDGGFETLFASFASRVNERIHYGCRISAICAEGKEVKLDDGSRYTYDRLISTMPLDLLIGCIEDVPDRVASLVGGLEKTSLSLVNVLYECTDTHVQRIYSAEDRYPFHRLVINSTSTPELRNGPLAVQAEITTSAPIPEAHIPLHVNRINECLNAAGVVKDPQPIDWEARFIEYAYPRQTIGLPALLKEARKYLQSVDIYICGRFGAWNYYNSDQVVDEALNLVEHLQSDANPSSRPTPSAKHEDAGPSHTTR